MSTLISITYSPDPGSYNRKPLDHATLVAGYGIEKDRKGGHPKRNLNIMDQDTLQQLAAEGYPAGAGDLGENLIIAGLLLNALAPGSRLQIGDGTVVECVELRTGCYKLTALDPRMPATMDRRLGYMASVIRGGQVRVGDPVVVLPD